MAAGDHIYVKRKGYTHHGVEVADGYVIHFKGSPGSNKLAALIVRTKLEDFGPSIKIRNRRYEERLTVGEAIARAESKLGESGYNLFSNNCEHFASWCVLGERVSRQVYTVAGLGGVSTATLSATAGTGSAVGAIGSVAGVSGAGIMSGLATAGGVVGGGAVAGLGVLGAGPAALSVAAVNLALKDDPGLSDRERVARRAGRRASVAGAAAGGSAAIAAVGGLGTAGLSAAGITSGLATIGGVVGGGMLAGTVAVVAAPAVVAAGAGFGIHRLVRHLKKSKQAEVGTPPGPLALPAPPSDGPDEAENPAA